MRPAGPGWSAVRAEAGVAPSPDSLPQACSGWVLGCVFVYSALFGTGSVLYGRGAQAAVWIAIFALSGRRARAPAAPSLGRTRSVSAMRKAVVLARGLGTRMRREDPSAASTPIRPPSPRPG